jgi:type IV secretion system protein VirB10
MDVYDSVNGSSLLIPKGTILVGKYNSEVKMGQEKVMAGFTRMIYPSGASADLGGMKAAESSGESGFSDEVDSHFWKMFGALSRKFTMLLQYIPPGRTNIAGNSILRLSPKQNRLGRGRFKDVV